MARTAPTSPAPLPEPAPLALRVGLPLALLGAALAAFWPCLSQGFVALDDDANFELNYLFRGLGREQLAWMWSGYHYGHWHPLTWLTFGLDFTLYGMDGPAFHRTSLAIHLLSVAAFWLLALELLRWCAGWVKAGGAPLALDRSRQVALHACAALATVTWALHPLRVENVAWLTERRDLLSALFLFLTVWAYLRMCREGSARVAWLALALAAYALSLLSKAWGMTLPVVLLALDVYPLRRLARPGREGRAFGALALEKLWFVPFAAYGAFQAASAQKAIAATVSFEEHGLLHRAAQASYGLCFYVLKTLWPTNLSCHHLLELGFTPTRPLYLAAITAVLAVTLAAWLLRQRCPAFLATWFLYGVLVSPVLGVLQSGAQKVADRYAHLSSIPFSFLLAGALLAWVSRGAPRARTAAVFACGGLLALALGVATNLQTRVWKDSETLFRRAVEVEPDNYFVLHNLAVMLYQRSAWAEAVEVEQRSVAAHPGRGNEMARHTLGLLHQRNNRMDLAEAAWRDALEWTPDPSDPRWAARPAFWMPDPTLCLNSLRGLLLGRGAGQELAELYEKGIARRPDVAQLYTDLDALYAQLNLPAKRLALWERAESSGVLPRAKVDAGLARALVALGRLKDAEPRAFRAAAAEKLAAQEVLDRIAQTLAQRDLAAGLELWERARKAYVPAAMVENGLGRLYLRAGRLPEAEPHLLRGQVLDSQNKEYLADVCELFLRQGRRADAQQNLQALLAVDPTHARAQQLLREAQSGGGGR